MSTGYAPITPEQEFAGLSANEARFSVSDLDFLAQNGIATESTYGELAPRVDAETGLGATALQSEVDTDFELSASDLDWLAEAGIDSASLTGDLDAEETARLEEIDREMSELAAHALAAFVAEQETKKMLEFALKTEDDEEKED